jgi:molybdopterin/thiamine biosynthesis adenylyltransferase/rhodanese-related sulfurtransferase
MRAALELDLGHHRVHDDVRNQPDETIARGTADIGRIVRQDRVLTGQGGESEAVHDGAAGTVLLRLHRAVVDPATHGVVTDPEVERSIFYPYLRHKGHHRSGYADETGDPLGACENREMQDAARYARQIALPGFGSDAQRKLSRARVLVIGAGGLGSSVIPALAAAGVGRIGVVDDDLVELSNLHRQLVHGVADVGSGKAQSAADSVAALNPATVVDVHDTRLDSTNALALFADYDLVIDGSDNFPTRYLANDAATITDIPLVWGAVSRYAGQVGIAWAAQGPQYRDLFPTPPPPGSVLSCEEGGVLPSTVAVIGSIMTGEAIKLLAGIGRPLLGRVTTFDALTGSFRELSYDRDPTAEPITELIDYDLFCGVAPSISAPELAERLDEITLVDVREPWETELAVIPGSRVVPVEEVEAAPDLVLYCHHGVRSARAVEVLAARGIHARQLTGGIDAWSRLVDPTVARY